MATRNETFFEALLNEKAAKWSAGVAFDRSNPLPLDQWSVFQTEAKATEYLSNAKAYPGQVIAYADANGEMVACVLSQNAEGSALTLKQIGVIPTGDESTIHVDENGAISLVGVESLVFERDVLDENKEPTGEKESIQYQALLTKDGLTWIEPSKTTVEGLATLIEGLDKRVVSLETKVGKAAEGEDKPATGLFLALNNETTRATAAEEALGKRIDAIDFIDSDELTEALAPYAKSADVVANSAFDTFKSENTQAIADAKSGAETTAANALSTARTEITEEIRVAGVALQSNIDKKVDSESYATDKKALQDEDKAIREIAEGVRDAFNTFMTSEEIDETVNTLKEVQAEIAKMTDAVELETALASKADKTYAEGLEDRIETLEQKPFDTYATKGEVEAVDGKFANYTDTEALTALLAGKQDTIPAETYDAYGSAAAAQAAAEATAAADATAKANAAQAAAEATAAADATSKANTAKSEAIADAATKYYGKSETYTKTEVDGLLEDAAEAASSAASGVEDKLNNYKKVVNVEVWGNEAGTGDSRIDTMETKLAGIAEGAQVNVIDSVVVNNGEGENVPAAKLTASVSGKTVTLNDSALQAATAEALRVANEGVASGARAEAAAAANAINIQTNATNITGLQTTSGQHGEAIAALQLHDSEHGAQYEALVKTVQEQGVSIANLGTGKADVSVVEGVSAKVTANEEAIKTLNETTIPGINGEIAKKADSSVIGDMGNNTVAGELLRLEQYIGQVEDYAENVSEAAVVTTVSHYDQDEYWSFVRVNDEGGSDTNHEYVVSVDHDRFDAAVQHGIKNSIGDIIPVMSFKGAAASIPINEAGVNLEQLKSEYPAGSTFKVTAEFSVSAEADAENKGFTAHVGDTIVLKEIVSVDIEGEDQVHGVWYLIPTGDDIEDTWRKIQVNGESIDPNSVAGSLEGRNNLEITNGTSTKGTFLVNNKEVSVYGVKTTQEAIEDSAVDGQYVTAVAQDTNGEITVSRKALSLYDATEVATAKDTTGEEEVEVPCLILCAGTASFLV